VSRLCPFLHFIEEELGLVGSPHSSREPLLVLVKSGGEPFHHGGAILCRECFIPEGHKTLLLRCGGRFGGGARGNLLNLGHGECVLQTAKWSVKSGSLHGDRQSKKSLRANGRALGGIYHGQQSDTSILVYGTAPFEGILLSLNRPRDLLSLSFPTLVMTEVEGTRGRVLHWARMANYSNNARGIQRRGTPQYRLPGKKGERHKEPNYQRKCQSTYQVP
jgi:hypothetical protein